jgi:phage-related protein (TIGR01555 family)
LLSETELEVLYVNGIPRRYVDSIADEILRHRTTIKLGDDNLSEERSQKLINDFEAFLQDSNFHHAFSEVVKLQRLYGGAGLVLLLDDGRKPEEPVDPARLRAVRGFIPLSRHELIPEDVTLTDWSKPAHYRISTNQRLTEDQTEITTNLIVHHTRVARFDGLYLPWNLRSQNTGWGMSVLQLVWDAFKRYETAMSGLENMTNDSDLFVHKIPGLFQRLAAGGEADIRKRLEANALSRSMYGGMVVDKEEEVDFINRALSNLASATEPFIQELQAATGWPASILMGTSPGGLGKEGRFEERVWASLVEQWQEVYCRSPITQVFTYILSSTEGPTRGRVPPAWSVLFPSVFTQTDEEKLDVRKKAQDIDVQYLSNGVLTPMEVRMARFGGQEYSYETTLDETATERMKVKEDIQFQAELVNMQRSMQPPQEETPPEDGATSPPGDLSQTEPVEDLPVEPELEP